MSTAHAWQHVVGIDDAPFDPGHRGDVTVIGAVYSGARLDGVLGGRVRRDGANATRVIAGMIRASRFFPQLQAVLLQGIAVAGFNVIDLAALQRDLGLPVLVIARRAPDLGRIRAALLEKVPGGTRKWRLIEAAGPMEPLAGLQVQRAGLSLAQAEALIRAHLRHGALPEPIRSAHLIAAGLAGGTSRQRA